LTPFDPKTVFFAKHAQHVVLIHFPIASLISAVAFDLISARTKRKEMAEAAYYNLLVAAVFTLPVLVTGVLAWRFQLEGQTVKGILLDHLVLGSFSSGLIWLVWWVHFRARRQKASLPNYRIALECFAVAVIALTAHLGGFLTGVNGPM